MTLIESLGVILAVVSLIITVIGFFASLKFYRDGVMLQNNANDALIKIEEKTQAIQTQVGGMFEKTLDAAIGKRAELAENFENVDEQLEKAKERIVEEAVKEIGQAGENERAKLERIVNKQLDVVKERVETAREAAETDVLVPRKMLSIPEKILMLLRKEGKPLRLTEIAERLELRYSITRSYVQILVAQNKIQKNSDDKDGLSYELII